LTIPLTGICDFSDRQYAEISGIDLSLSVRSVPLIAWPVALQGQLVETSLTSSNP
jgi:hypothetical protein